MDRKHKRTEEAEDADEEDADEENSPPPQHQTPNRMRPGANKYEKCENKGPERGMGP